MVSSGPRRSFTGCCSIVPVHILERLKGHPDPEVVRKASATMRISNNLAVARAQMRPGPFVTTALVRQGCRRQIFDCGNTEDLPGETLLRGEGGTANADAAANEAYDNSGKTWDFYNQVFGRQSVDNRGKMLTSSVQYGDGYDNAFWTGNQMAYGDGDRKVFQHFTGALEVVAHELTHGLTQFTAQLDYQGQSGALNESFSDVFGSLVKQWSLGQAVDQADWLIGAGILAPGVSGPALRDMANPGTAYHDPILGTDPQPGHMSNYVDTDGDNGGVHINSGIPNRAFVLTAAAIGGRAWEIAGKIWYVTLSERLGHNADFRKCAFETISVARDYFAKDTTVAAHVAQAWIDTGVLTVEDVNSVTPPRVA